jgi:hypothetical protein
LVEAVTLEEIHAGEVLPTSAVEPTAPATPQPANQDQQLVAKVISSLSRAKQDGRLRGFGVDVKCYDGVLHLKGRASSADQRDQILQIAQHASGTGEIRESIAIPTALPSLPRLPEPPVLRDPGVQATPVSNRPAAPPRTVAAPQPPRGQAAGYRGNPRQPIAARPASYGTVAGAPVVGQPVPMAPYSGVAGAPRYDSPQLPNYAWPGYASHPNYAALTYPQQYSPTAWPYIGPFYPYPQVPLGWRSVCLEWDDGWWYLDFTTRHDH